MTMTASERYRQAVGRWSVAVATAADAGPVLALAAREGPTVADPTALGEAIASGRCLVARADDDDPVGGEIVGLAAHGAGLFGWPLLTLVVTRVDRRRQGVGSALVLGVIGRQAGDRLFAGVRDADVPARMLLGRLGFVADGYVEHADDDGARLVYIRWLNGAGPAVIPSPSEPPE